MIRRSLFLLAALLFVPVFASAQDATPTPPANPMVFDDPAMHFEAPASFGPVAQRKIALDDLTDDLQVVAAWASKTKPVHLILQQQSFEGPVNSFLANFKQQLRGAYGDASFKPEEHTALKNGMPAIFVSMTAGEGFNVTTIYTLMWADGLRGCALSITAPVGSVTAADARELMSNVSAVRYPRRQE